MFEAPSPPDLNLISPIESGYYNSPNYSPESISYGGSTPSNSLMYSAMGASFIGAITNGLLEAKAVRALGDYQSSIARTNATIAGVQERQAIETGNVVASRKSLETQATVGAVRAVQGASGVDVSTGSAAAVRTGIAGAGATDVLTIKNNAARQAWGFQTEALEDTYKGQFAQLTAKSKANQSLLNGGLEAIQGPLNIQANYLRYARWMGGSSAIPFPGAA